jgi:type IV pilus assembly protein PilE
MGRSQQLKVFIQRYRDRGFTLIELVIAIAIIGVLVVVAYPSYIKYVARSNRAAAEAYMLEVSAMQQRYLVDARGYAADMATLGASPPSTVSANYTITTTKTDSPPTFLVTATLVPGSNQEKYEATCGALTIDQTGAKTAAGGTTLLAQCWQR